MPATCACHLLTECLEWLWFLFAKALASRFAGNNDAKQKQGAQQRGSNFLEKTLAFSML
jgi:hypothetical protein